MSKPWYLAGPMTGIPQFNFPAFVQATGELRAIHGLDVISPAELDDEATARAAMESPDGAPGSGGNNGETWGDYLARDVKLIADKCGGIIFLDGWEKSRGARLEAFVGLLNGVDFARFIKGVGIEQMSAQTVLTKIVRVTHEELRDG